MEATNSSETGAVLSEWRTRILNGFLAFAAAALVPVVGMTFIAATKRPEQWPAVALFTVLLLLLAVLAFWRGLDLRVRAAGLLLLGFVAAAVSLARGGLAGSGRDYLVVLPIVALILVGVRAGVLLSAFSALVLAIFAVLADRGFLLPWLVNTQNPQRLVDWVIEGGTTLVLLAITMMLLILFHRFQVKTIKDQHRTAGELDQARALLEEQNTILEQKVKERTEELLENNKIQATLNKIAEAASTSHDMQEFYAHIHRIVGELMYAENMFIALYDESTGLLSFPYFVDEKDEPFATQPLENFHGMTSYVIRTGESIKHGWDQFNALMTSQEVEIEGTLNEDGIGAPLKADGKTLGAIFVQSYTKGIHYTDKDDQALAFVAQHIATALARVRALEAERQRTAELATINSVQAALAVRLDVQDIYDSVGDKIREVFHDADLSIRIYDPKTDLIYFPYFYESGKRWSIEPSPMGNTGFTHHVLHTRETLVINENMAQEYENYGSWVLPGTQMDKSAIYVPLLTGNQAYGLINLYSMEREHAFSDSDVRLLQTLANSMSIALENARLFDETQEARAAAEQANTEIKQAQEALQESHRQLANIVNFMPDAVLVIDEEGKVIIWNRAIEEMTGTKAEEMLGKGDYEYALPFYGERRPILIDLVRVPQKELEEKYSQIRMEGPVLVGETYVPQLRGGGHYLLGTASPLHDSKGQVVGAIEVIRDFSERKHMEEALHQAKEAAEAATQTKSAFLATMSHEIRTPMNAVIGMTGLLLDTPLTPEQREFAETIRTSGDALLTIINDVLDFSKIEARRMELESQPFDLRECVESAMDLLAPSATEKGLNLGCVVERDVPAAIVGDVTRLRQVLVNLLSNAVKFTERGEVVVTVTTDAETRGHGDTETVTASPPLPITASLHFAVRDTGIGIPPELMGRLFQSFSQVDASTTRRFGGTGLGLAISWHLTELMGGTMWAESPAASPLQVGGPGSVFHFTVRAEVASAPTAHAYPQGIQPRLEGKRALIVDDNPTNRRILSLQTQAWGMHPQQTGSPAEVLEWLRRGDMFDVAFLDLQMPTIDGVALAAEIRQLRDASALPLVILSSLGKREAQAEEGDWAAFLLKPIKASQLYNVLVDIFGTEAAEAPIGQAPSKPQFEADLGQRHPLRILLAEDNLVNQKLALRLLERMGYRADVAANGLEVLQSLRRQPYDVILMDVQMPEMDGLEASRAIWGEWPAEVRPRIVAMTANVMPEDRQECLAAGMDDFIAKPIRVDELVAALSRSQPLAGRATPADSGRPAALLDPAALERLRETAGGDAGFLKEMFETFLADAPGMLAEMHQSLERGDAATLRRAAHSLKSNSADFGAKALSDLCRELEMMGKTGALEGAAEKLASIEAEWAQVRAALERQQEEEGGQPC